MTASMVLCLPSPPAPQPASTPCPPDCVTCCAMRGAACATLRCPMVGLTSFEEWEEWEILVCPSRAHLYQCQRLGAAQFQAHLTLAPALSAVQSFQRVGRRRGAIQLSVMTPHRWCAARKGANRGTEASERHREWLPEVACGHQQHVGAPLTP